MDEKISRYLESKFEKESFYDGKISGYILDSMVMDYDADQVENEAEYISYEELLSQYKELRDLHNMYVVSQRIISKSDLKLNNRKHYDDILRAEGIYVLPENKNKLNEFVSDYIRFMALTVESNKFLWLFAGPLDTEPDESKHWRFSLHRGDLIDLGSIVCETEMPDPDDETNRYLAKTKAEAMRAKAQLKLTASSLLLEPGNRPMSSSASAAIGGVFAGTTGAVIGALSGIERNRSYEDGVRQYLKQKDDYEYSAQELIEGAQILEEYANSTEQHFVKERRKYKVLGLRTFFGVLPLCDAYFEEKSNDLDVIKDRKDVVTNYIKTGEFDDSQNFLILEKEIVADESEMANDYYDYYREDNKVDINDMFKYIKSHNGVIDPVEYSKSLRKTYSTAAEMIAHMNDPIISSRACVNTLHILAASGQVKKENDNKYTITNNIRSFSIPNTEYIKFYLMALPLFTRTIYRILKERGTLTLEDVHNYIRDNKLEDSSEDFTELNSGKAYSSLMVITGRGYAKHIVSDKGSNTWEFVDKDEKERIESEQKKEKLIKRKEELTDNLSEVKADCERKISKLDSKTFEHKELTEKIEGLKSRISELMSEKEENKGFFKFIKRRELDGEISTLIPEMEKLQEQYNNELQSFNRHREEARDRNNSKVSSIEDRIKRISKELSEISDSLAEPF